ncbi:MAG: hypothetical protein ACP5FK_10590 [bacterium]
MKKFTGICLFLITVSTIILYSQSPEWGQDLQIMEGEICCFDCDYMNDGTMIVAVQKDTVVLSPDSYPIILYKSTNHGGSWSVLDTVQAINKYQKIKILISEWSNNYLYIFFVAEDPTWIDNLGVHRYNLATNSFISTEQVSIDALPTGFDACLYEHQGNPHVTVLFWKDDSTLNLYKSDDGGVYWTGTGIQTAQGKAFDPECSITHGPREELYLAYSMSSQTTNHDSLNIYGEMYNAINYSPIGTTFIIADQTHACLQPRIACSNDSNNPAIWCAYTYEYNLYQNDLDVRVASVLHPDSAEYNWNQTSVGTSSYMDAGADIRFYKVFGNAYVNMCYLYHDLALDTTKVFWGWSVATNPTSWYMNSSPLNDNPCHYIADGTSPKLLYSPGANGSGSTVVYAGYLRYDLWIDAPWSLQVEEVYTQNPHLNILINSSVINRHSPVYFTLPENCTYQALLYDLSGRVIWKSNLISGIAGENNFHIEDLTPGAYFMEIRVPEKDLTSAHKRITVL